MDNKDKRKFPDVWCDRNRDVAWTILSFSRVHLNLTISPVFASTFILLHHYFLNNPDPKHPLYLLVISSLFLSCKIEDLYRPVQVLFKAFSKTCLGLSEHLPERIISEALGGRDFKIDELNEDEIRQISGIEVDILNSVEWNMSIDIPFTYFNNHKSEFSSLDGSIVESVCSKILRNICIVIKSAYYLDIPPELTAVVATTQAFEGNVMPEATRDWINSIKMQDEILFTRTLNLVRKGAQRCVQVK